MNQIGMRELRHNLRGYLRRVERGEGFDVTLFGRPIARLGPLPTRTSIERLIVEGKVTPPPNPDTTHLPVPVEPTEGVNATDALLAERDSDQR